MTQNTPPSLATWLISRLLPAEDRDAVIGDLAEEYDLVLRSGTSADANSWYWRQTAASAGPALWWSLRSGRGLLTLGIALAAFVGASIVEFVAEFAASAFMAAGTVTRWIVSLVISLSAMALGGYVASVIRPNSARAMAVLVFAIIVALLVTRPESVPLWYGIACLPLGPLAVLSGARIGRKK